MADLFYEKRYSHTQMVNPDFVALAKAMHCHAIRCDSLADLPAKMKEFMEYDNNKPIVMDARTVKSEHVYPMVCHLFQLFFRSSVTEFTPSFDNESGCCR